MPEKTKKADVVRRPKAFDHVGLLINGPLVAASCPLFSHPTTSIPFLSETGELFTPTPFVRYYSGPSRKGNGQILVWPVLSSTEYSLEPFRGAVSRLFGRAGS